MNAPRILVRGRILKSGMTGSNKTLVIVSDKNMK